MIPFIPQPKDPRFTTNTNSASNRPASSPSGFMNAMAIGTFSGGIATVTSFAGASPQPEVRSRSDRNSVPSGSSGSTASHWSSSPSRTSFTSSGPPPSVEEEKQTFFIWKNKKPHHAFPVSEAPYPLCYDRDVLDHDVLNLCQTMGIARDVTFHQFDQPPTRVLDLGTGTGAWVLDAAQKWKNAMFFGFDLVPLQPDLRRLGQPDLAHRIKWVQGNFLDRLPFPDEYFDYVHIRRIARGVPESKWGLLFEEISRVMKQNAPIEMIEENFPFPLPSPATSSHTKLKQIYQETHTHRSRFINLTPLSVVPSYLSLHFRGMRMTDLEIGGQGLGLGSAVSGVLGCSESMWEYVQQTQADEPNLEDEIDRDDFDMLLQQYSHDMKDQVGLAQKLNTRMNWSHPTRPGSSSGSGGAVQRNVKAFLARKP